MLIPQFSIRVLLLLTGICAVLSIAVAQAIQGTGWAVAFSAMLALTVLVFLVYALTFSAAYGLAKLTRSLKPPAPPANPFVQPGHFPPQAVPHNPAPDVE